MRLKVEVGRFSPATTEILPKNRLNVGRGFTPRRWQIRRQGIKPCPTREIGLNVGRGFTPHR